MVILHEVGGLWPQESVAHMYYRMNESGIFRQCMGCGHPRSYQILTCTNCGSDLFRNAAFVPPLTAEDIENRAESDFIPLRHLVYEPMEKPAVTVIPDPPQSAAGASPFPQEHEGAVDPDAYIAEIFNPTQTELEDGLDEDDFEEHPTSIG